VLYAKDKEKRYASKFRSTAFKNMNISVLALRESCQFDATAPRTRTTHLSAIRVDAYVRVVSNPLLECGAGNDFHSMST